MATVLIKVLKSLNSIIFLFSFSDFDQILHKNISSFAKSFHFRYLFVSSALPFNDRISQIDSLVLSELGK